MCGFKLWLDRSFLFILISIHLLFPFQLNSSDSEGSPLNAGRFRIETGEREGEEVGYGTELDLTGFVVSVNTGTCLHENFV